MSGAAMGIAFIAAWMFYNANDESRWGIEVEGVRLTAGGYMLDFRYRIMDHKKAAAIVDRRIKPYLIDKKSSAKLMIPSSPKVGPMRQTVKYGDPPEGRTLFVMFANPGRLVKQGDEVAVVIGDFKADNLIVR